MKVVIAIVAALAVVSSTGDALARSGHFKEQSVPAVPSVKGCASLLKQFTSQSYKLRDLSQVIPLDTCLGYTFEDSAQQLKKFAESTELKALYDGTNLSGEGMECVVGFLTKYSNLKGLYSSSRSPACNNHLMRAYLQFADCQAKRIPSEARSSDTYLQIVYDLVRESVQACVTYELDFIPSAVHKTYDPRRLAAIANKNNPRDTDVNRVLLAFAATKNPAEIKQLIRGVIKGDEETKSKLLDNLSKFAIEEIDAEKLAEFLRYKMMMNLMCSELRATDYESQMDFATPITRLTLLLAYEDFRFATSPKEFIQKMLAKSADNESPYLAIQACNIISVTEGSYDESSKQFSVVFKPEMEGLIAWPEVDTE